MIFANPELFRMALFFTEDRSLVECRVHGTLHLDTANIGWHDNTAAKRAEVNVYSDLPIEAIEPVMALFAQMPSLSLETESIYVIDSDDPELVELGEDGVHERLTSHFSDPPAQPKEEWEPWIVPHLGYIDNLFPTTMAQGYVPPALAQEGVWQRMAFPYKWIGATVD